jgi:hypothetical protein
MQYTSYGEALSCICFIYEKNLIQKDFFNRHKTKDCEVYQG